MDFVSEIMSVARSFQASTAEKEVERLMKIVLRGTIFSNKTHAVGGYVVIILLYSTHGWR
jgi:hypothetical protein